MTKRRQVKWPSQQEVTDALLAGAPLPSVKDQLGKRRLGPITKAEADVLRVAFEVNPTLMLPTKTLAKEIAKRTGGDVNAIRRTLQRISKIDVQQSNPAIGGGLLGIEPLPMTRAQRLRLLLIVGDNL
jgi:hypothetical protein